MIRQAIENVLESETKIVGHDLQVTEEQVLAFLTQKFGKIDVVSSFTEVGNMIKMLFVAQGHTSTYTTETKFVIDNVVF